MAETDDMADSIFDFLDGLDGFYDDAFDDIFGDEVADWERYI